MLDVFLLKDETVKRRNIEIDANRLCFYHRFALQAESIDVLLNRSTRSKLEHYGFQQLNRSVSSLRQGKRPTSSTDNPNKKMRPVDVTPTAA